MGRPKLFKVRRSCDLKVYGVAARSFGEFKQKACKALCITTEKLVRICHIDGTQIDDEDYLMNLEPNSLLVFECTDDESTPASSISTSLKALRMDDKTALELLKLAKNTTDKIEKNVLVSLVHHMRGNLHAETREEDPDWFKRVADKKVNEKSTVLETSAMNRVRSYFYEAKSHIRESSLTATQRQLANNVLEEWWSNLKKYSMYRYYFSRTKCKSYTFCDRQGWFLCEGDYLSKTCSDQHSINPYLSSEHRAIFSQWNLDHQIEKSRTVLPKLIELIKMPKTGKKVNWEYFFNLLFTRSNLKLVHITCHIKQEHTTAKIDTRKLFL